MGNLPLRKLGNSGLSIPPVAVGGNVFGWTVDQGQSFALLDAFLAGGLNFIDTADVYSKWKPGNSGGESERIIGEWMKARGNRERVLIATKCGMELSPTDQGLSKNYILRAAERSLKNLQTDYIDLYQAHKDDEHTPLEETLAAFGQLIKAGKARAIGASNYSAERLAAAMEVSRRNHLPRYESLQPLYNLYDRQAYEEALEPLCEKEGLGVIPYFSLASGFLTGKYRSEADLAKSARGQGNKKYLNERGMRILKALDGVAARVQSTPARVAIAWLLARPTVTAPIASATALEQIGDLLAAMELHLDAGAMKELNQASEWRRT